MCRFTPDNVEVFQLECYRRFCLCRAGSQQNFTVQDAGYSPCLAVVMMNAGMYEDGVQSSVVHATVIGRRSAWTQYLQEAV